MKHLAKKRILSGIQPTGCLHLGNYLGALKNWVSMQGEGESLFCVVDLHALTVPQDPSLLKKNILETAMLYMAAGIDPKKSVVFIQSMVPAHSELAWILSCHTPLGWLNRMTQFKDKAGQKQDQQKLGLYAYPVLMAADILIYRATHVPVGEDQKQHLELARDMALLMNRAYKAPLFPIPEPQILGPATRVMSLKDGLKKMSKSDPAEGSRINLLDDADTIYKKIKRATTDSDPLPHSLEKLIARPEVSNLVHIFAALKGEAPFSICQQYGGGNFSIFKEDLAVLCMEALMPIQRNFTDLKQAPEMMHTLLQNGAEQANHLARETLKSVKEHLGLPV